jgi:ligand-binding SRPBCC domain-containing protein
MLSDRAFARAISLLGTSDHPPRGLQSLHAETIVTTRHDRTFAFFSDAGNLERLTPPWLNFRIRTPRPIEMREGTIIDYEIVLYGIPMPWRTRIDVWEPGVRFVDRQVAGPYVWWRHEHRFERTAAGTLVVDDVWFRPRAALLSAWMVARDVNRIFDFRQRSLASLLEDQAVHA